MMRGYEPDRAANIADGWRGFGPSTKPNDHPCWKTLIDHPGYISHLRKFIGRDIAVLDGGENIVRWPGQACHIHGGGHDNGSYGVVSAVKGGLAYSNNAGDGVSDLDQRAEAGEIRCSMISVMLALNDCPAEGGGTMLVPGSHKSNRPHPRLAQGEVEGDGTNMPMDGV